MSAVARLLATGMFHRVAIRSRAFTSVSCGWGCSGSQKNTRASISPWAMHAPICWSPPSGPLRKRRTGMPSWSARIRPVEPVAYTV